MPEVIKEKIQQLERVLDTNLKIISSEFVGSIDMFDIDENGNIPNISGANFKLIMDDKDRMINIFDCVIEKDCLIPSHKHNLCKEVLIVRKGKLTRIETREELEPCSIYIHDVGEIHTYFAEKGTEYYCMFIPAIELKRQ